jgi:hypothetical protein
VVDGTGHGLRAEATSLFGLLTRLLVFLGFSFLFDIFNCICSALVVFLGSQETKRSSRFGRLTCGGRQLDARWMASSL